MVGELQSLMLCDFRGLLRMTERNFCNLRKEVWQQQQLFHNSSGYAEDGGIFTDIHSDCSVLGADSFVSPEPSLGKNDL